MPPRDHRPRHQSPHLSLDGFLLLHLTLLKTRLRLAWTTLASNQASLSFREVEPGSDDGKRKKPDARRLDRNASQLTQRESELRAELVVAWQESRLEDKSDPLHALKSSFRLGELESDLFTLVIARHLDPSMSDLFVELGVPHGLAAPVLLLALHPATRPTELHNIVRADSRLVRFALLESADLADPLLSPLMRPLRLVDGVVDWLLNHPDALPVGVSLVSDAPNDPRLRTNGSLSHLNRLRTMVAAQVHSKSPSPIALRGDPSNSPRVWANAIAHQQGRHLMVAKVEQMVGTQHRRPDDILHHMRVLGREARHRERATILLDLRGGAIARLEREVLSLGIRELADQSHPLFVALDRHATDLELTLGVSELPFPLPEVDLRTRIEVWRESIDDDISVNHKSGIDWLAAREDLGDADRGLILARAFSLTRRRDNATHLEASDLALALQSFDSPQMRALAERIQRRVTWDEPIFEPATSTGLRTLVKAVHGRRGVARSLGDTLALGTGLSAVFVGPLGTGKTRAAEQVALETGLNVTHRPLYHLIGETGYETRQRIDALLSALGTTTLLIIEVRSSIGRPRDDDASADAMNALLHALERFDGVTVFETDSLEVPGGEWLADSDHVVTFNIPNEEQRLALWRRAFPQPEILTDGLSFGVLASQFEMGPGMIRRAALKAALAASPRPHPENRVTFQDLWEASRACYRLLGHEAPTLEHLR